MTDRDLEIVNELLKRIENLPDILHLRASPVDYKLTESDEKLLFDTYQNLDDILKEVAAFINIRFPNRKDFITAWNEIDFDTKIGAFKIITTDREHIKSEWKKGIYDLKSLVKSLLNEVRLLVEIEKELKKNPLFDKAEWYEYYDKRLEKRADQADFFLDMIIEKGLIKLDNSAVRKYFKQWFIETQEFDLQIKDGDFAIEDGDFQMVPDFSQDNIPEFLTWFKDKGNNFIDYLNERGVSVENGSKETIINSGNLIINNKSKIKKQTIGNNKEENESNWSKANVIIALVVGITTVIGIIWGIFS